MIVDRPWPLYPVIDGVEYRVSFDWPSSDEDVPNKVTVARGNLVLYRADIQASSHAEAEQIALRDLDKYLEQKP